MLSNSLILELLTEEWRTTRELLDLIPPAERKPNDYRVLDRKLKSLYLDGKITYRLQMNSERKGCEPYAVKLWVVERGQD